MILLYILAAFFVFQNSHTASVDEYKSYKNYRFYKVQGHDRVTSKLITIMGELTELPFYDVRRSEAHLLIAPELASIFEETVRLIGLNATVVVEDYSELIKEEKSGSKRRKGFSWTAYYDVDDIYNFLRNTSKAFPKITELAVAGKSYEGRELLGLRINSPKKTKAGKPVVFIESGIHAREWITPATTTYFINQLLTSSDPKITRLRDQFDWRIFPTVNPDGYHYSFRRDRMWRKTRSRSPGSRCYGADPNRNWDFHWLEHGANDNPCDYQVYAGSKPFSEVETRSLANYLRGIDNLLAYVAFHSDAQCLLVPYSDSTEHTGNYDDLIEIGKTSLEYGEKVNGAKYKGPATAGEILYKASGGSMDWVRSELGTPLVYTYELRGTYFQWPASRINEQGDEYTQMMIGLFDEAENLGYF